MAKVPKQKRIKRPTVVINRARCIKSTKPKSYSPLYQKLKVNNHLLARALSQEKQESQILFTKNVQLLAEVQDLTHACNTRELVIANVLKNAKDMMQILVTMSGYLTNTISSCQEFVSSSSSVNLHRSSTSSVGRRESTRRLSTKSPARGVVKPMVSGHTITKPTINLSRVNMQRLQDINLSIIEEGPVSPERNLDRSVQENMRSCTLPERISHRNDDDEEHIIVNRTSRFSGGRLSSGRYSKRNSGRLSGRLSKRSSDLAELIKSPRVTLQDVSRYLANNQSVNIRALNENSSVSLNTSMETTVKDTQPSSPENQNNATITENQESCETSESDEESNTVRTKKSASTTNTRSSKRSSTNNKSCSLTSFMESDLIDPMEGPSWLCDSSANSSEEQTSLNNGAIDSNSDENDESINHQQSSSASVFNSERRRNSQYFKVPELPKSYNKSTVSRLNVEDDYSSSASTSVPLQNGLDIATRFSEQEDEEDCRVITSNNYVTQRRGVSSRAVSGYDSSPNASGVGIAEDVDDFEDDETMMMNIQRQINMQQQQTRQIEQTERLQFDVNELLQLTPLRPLLSLNARNNIGPAQVDNETEVTATVQLTQGFPKPESSDTLSRMSTIKLQQNGQPNLPSHTTVRSQEPNNNGQERRLSELTTIQLESSRINLPRLTEILSTTHADNHQPQMCLSPEIGKQVKMRKTLVQKRKRIMKQVEVTNSGSEDNDEITPVKRKKKSNQRKKKTKDKDPSAVKVVLQKLNETTRSLNQSENAKSERKNSNESISSVRSSGLTRDPSSDSESSVTSVNSKPISTRPRRQKAPTNLQEPSLSKKLRR